MDEQRVVYLALPGYGGVEPEMMMSALQAVAGSGNDVKIVARSVSFSLLAHCFNIMWCEALNTRNQYGYTHFAMLHGDISPQGDWLKILLDEQERTGADILSAVVPIKDDRGIMSTMHRVPGAKEHTRLTIDDLDQLPVSFDCSFWPGETLHVNSGLWVCDFTKPWVEKVWFDIIDRIEFKDGIFMPYVFSEDWNFSQKAADAGAKVWATQILGLSHMGRNGWRLQSKSEREEIAVPKIISEHAA